MAALTSGVVAASGSSPAGAEASGDPDPGVVSVIEVSGLLDRVLVDFVEQEINAAEDAGMVALVLQLNSKGAVVADAEIDALVERIEDADVPVDSLDRTQCERLR